jgi:NhaP-type Na+/H+ or K+/H+ antiporter
MKQDLITGLLGTKTIGEWIISLLFVTLGIAISLYADSLTRKKESLRTPLKYSISFLIKDNLIKILFSFFIVYTLIRFSEEIISIELKYFHCLFLGLGFDLLLTLPLKYQKKGRDFINNL